MAKTSKPSGQRANKTKGARNPAARDAGPRKKKAGTARAGRPLAADAKRQDYAEALKVYESALETLQRGKYEAAAPLFQRIIDDFPDERELHERSRRYLEVCQRQTAPQPKPQTTDDQVYAATLALNTGDADAALAYLEPAVRKEPDSDRVQYMLALAHAAAGTTGMALTHLHRAVELNPDNRFLARHESGFDALRNEEAFEEALGLPGRPSPLKP